MLARKLLNANVSCRLTLANMLLYLVNMAQITVTFSPSIVFSVANQSERSEIMTDC